MSRDERERLLDIKDALEAIKAHLERTSSTKPQEAPLLHDALLFQFVVIGEAVKNLAPETRESAPHIPWSDIAGLRDLIPTSTSGSRSIEFSRSSTGISLHSSRPSIAC